MKTIITLILCLLINTPCLAYTAPGGLGDDEHREYISDLPAMVDNEPLTFVYRRVIGVAFERHMPVIYCPNGWSLGALGYVRDMVMALGIAAWQSGRPLALGYKDGLLISITLAHWDQVNEQKEEFREH